MAILRGMKPRISLRTILLVTAIVALALGWAADRRRLQGQLWDLELERRRDTDRWISEMQRSRAKSRIEIAQLKSALRAERMKYAGQPE
jgi:hypothetical protein